MACHKEIGADVAARRGFHGRQDNAAKSECRACHTEHLGREVEIVHLSPATFDHKRTDFVLDGAHNGVACAACHRAGAPYAKAPGTCIGCHRKDDAHRGQLGTQCENCHRRDAWSPTDFDHDRTAMPLRDAHRLVACGACHLNGRYKGIAKTCIGCHTPDDVHVGSRGEKCGNCHTTASWKDARFDHFKETGFALLGSHTSLACGHCHKNADFKDKPPKDCAGCHRGDDAHATRFGTDCGTCHGNDAWKPVEYDHAQRAKFALLGKHAKIDCHSCHTGRIGTPKLPTDCATCHRASDVHGNALKAGCDACHNSSSWTSEIRFDHDLTDFPLVGLHAIVTCAQCHASKAFRGAARDCIGCHRQDDVHKGRLGKDCTACHSPNSWKQWDFDHAQTGFPLSGAHQKLQCANCHRQPAGTVRLAQDCASCHRKDDVHLGQYGLQCQRCHSTLTFHGARIQ